MQAPQIFLDHAAKDVHLGFCLGLSTAGDKSGLFYKIANQKVHAKYLLCCHLIQGAVWENQDR